MPSMMSTSSTAAAIQSLLHHPNNSSSSCITTTCYNIQSHNDDDDGGGGGGGGGGEVHDGEDDACDFFDSREETMSIRSTSHSTCSQYYDAAEDFFSDGYVSSLSPSLHTNIKKELKDLRFSLIDEAERRNNAEKCLLYIHMQWQRISACLFQMQYSGDEQLELDPAVICQEIIVTSLVSDAIEKALARVEAEIITEMTIDSKNNEISRLRDRLQYHEAVNHEMSQRNQESVEFTRQQRLGRKARWRLVWGCVGLSVTFGASLLAYSYTSTSNSDVSTPSSSISVESQGF